MNIIVDRIEGEWAVLEVGEHRVNFPLAALPQPVREGDLITLEVQPPPQGALDDARARLQRLQQSSPPGDSFDI
jgi:hypothetical protein